MLLCTNADFNGEIWAHCGSYCVQYLQCQPGPVFQAAAVFVGAPVVGRREELLQQPAMSCMEQYHFEARFFHQSSPFAILLNQHMYHFSGHLLDYGAIVQHVRTGAISDILNVFALVYIIGSGILSSMVQLGAGNGPMPLNGRSGNGKPRKHIGRIQTNIYVVAFSGLSMNNTLAYGYYCCASPGTQLKKRSRFGGQITLGSYIRISHRCRKDAVFKINVAHPQRTKQMWELSFQFIQLLSVRLSKCGPF